MQQPQQRVAAGRALRMERLPFKRRPPGDEEPQVPAKKRLSFGAMAHFLLPNGTSVRMELQKEKWMDFDGLFEELEKKSGGAGSSSSSRAVDWRGNKLVIEDESGNKIEAFDELFQGKSIFLIQDGGEDTVHKDEELWNVTPEPEMLERLPDGYSIETALADHVDNALQAVWDWDEDSDGREGLVSVEIKPDSIVIFDTGHGMDASKNSIAKWGTVGASSHRDVHHKGIGGEPPYLKPYLGKYGVGGVAAALHLGRHVEVRSKTTRSKKVVSLILQKGEINQDKDRGSGVWRTHGGFHEMTEDEAAKAPHGSFTSVKITGLNPEACIKGEQLYWKLERVKRMLKDIYSLYIQCDDERDGQRRDGKRKRQATFTSVTFEVNGDNLLGESGGDVTTCNKHSCPGDPFVVYFDFESGSELAHGRLTCHYFPNVKGRETLENVIDELNKHKIFSSEKNFDNYPRVGARWLGRLLPSAHWDSMPFMVSELKGRDQQHWVKRVKIFADLDAGFQPTPTKTNLVGSHHFTVALKQLGSRNKTEPDVEVKIRLKNKNKSISGAELSKEFKRWLIEMHEKFDEDVEFSGDPTYVINHKKQYNKILGVEKDVLSFYKGLSDRGGDWKAGDRVKLLKAFNGKRNFFGTIEWFFCDGPEDSHGEVKMVCRPIEILTEGDDEDSSIEIDNQGSCSFEINGCVHFSVLWWLNSDRCQRVDDEEWSKRLSLVQDKLPASVEILTGENRSYFNEPELPESGSEFDAGYHLPGHLLAVVRPRRFTVPGFKQETIVKAEDIRLQLEVSVQETSLSAKEVLYTEFYSSSTRGCTKGIFVFSTRPLTKAGQYMFRVSQADDSEPELKPACFEVKIRPLAVETWSLRGPEKLRMDEPVGSPLHVEGHDKYRNRVKFDKCKQFPLTLVTVTPAGNITAALRGKNIKLSSDIRSLELQSFVFPGFKMDPSREAQVFLVKSDDGQKLGQLKCEVLPAKLASVTLTQCSKNFTCVPYTIEQHLKPGDVIRMSFQAEDKYGNRVSNEKLTVKVDGLEPVESQRKVDENGFLHFDELRVANQFNTSGSLSLFTEDNIKVAEVLFTLATRKLVFAAPPPERVNVGRLVKGLTVQVIDEDGELDDSMKGTLSASWENSVCFNLHGGVCSIPAIQMPREPGVWSGSIWHSTCEKIAMSFEILLEHGPACRIEKISDSVVQARCSGEFDISFRALDGLGLPALLDDATTNEMDIHLHPEEDLLALAEVLEHAHLIGSSESINIHTLKIVLRGKLGGYKLTLVSPPTLSPENLTWSVHLAPGPVARLVPVVLRPADSPGAGDPELLLERASQASKPSIQRRQAFPTLLVHLLDSNNNICDQYDGEEVVLTLPDHPRIEQKQQVIKGCAQFLPFPVDLQAGSYELQLIFNAPEEVQSITSFPFRVEPGNFPSALHILESPPPEITISDLEDQPRLPLIRVSVESEDGKPLASGLHVFVSIYVSSGEVWVEGYRGVRHSSSEFHFGDVLVPTQTGVYELRFFIAERQHGDVPPISLKLEVIHGSAVSLQFSDESARNSLLVDVVDRYGNRCLSLDSGEVVARFQGPGANLIPAEYKSPVRSGRAVLEGFKIKPAIYTITVSMSGNQQVRSISSSISAVCGEHPGQNMSVVFQALAGQNPQYNSLLATTRKMQQELTVFKPRIVQLVELLKISRDKLGVAELKREQLRVQQTRGNDDRVLATERLRPPITISQMINSLSPMEDAAARAISLAQKDLPPGFPATDILGLAFTFARVETKELNDVLSTYLGNKLLTIVCKSERASSWIEPMDSTGNVDRSRGLYEFAESKNQRITGSIPVIYLKSITGFIREDGEQPVDTSHLQKLLRIPEPLLPSGNTPPGFLGFAVNMLHLKEQHLQLHLRQTLFFHLLGKLQVYDTRRNMLDARTQLLNSSPGANFSAVSLDGASCSGAQVTLGMIGVPRLCFASVPFGEREKAALAPPAAAAFRRQAEMESLNLGCAKLQEIIEGALAEKQEVENSIHGREERIRLTGERFLHCELIPEVIAEAPTPLQWRPPADDDLVQVQLFNAPRN